jgi:hypothetical protein
MRLEIVFIPVIFALAVAAMLFIKPVEVRKTDLSAVFLYWPEAYKYAEVGNPSAIYRVTGLRHMRHLRRNKRLPRPGV